MKRLALLLAGAAVAFQAAPALAQTDEAVERSELRANLPAMLSDAQQSDYRSVFAAIRAGDWAGAASRLDATGDGPLHAVARAELYLAKGSPKVELEPLLALIQKAPELPQAAQLERLALKRGATALPDLPVTQRLIWFDGQPRRARAKSARNDPAAAELEALVQPLIRDNQPAAAEALLNEQAATLTPDALTEYQQRIGWSYYIVGDDASARRLGERARAGIGEWTLLGEWLTALAAWRSGDCDAASASFNSVAQRATDMESSAAGHYWSARADMMCGHPDRVQPHLRTAARMDETFYGMLAQSALGLKPRLARRTDDASEWRGIVDRPDVRAAIALVEVGETGLADEMLRQQAQISPRDHRALVHLAAALNLPATQLWLVHNVPLGARVEMADRYPMPGWRPVHGWRVDPSLVFAHTLQESGFRTDAVSAAGAVGLLQVRPGSAGDMARSRGESFDPRSLTQPSANIEYGQSYMEYLRDYGATSGLLPKVIAAFNAGTGPVAEWNSREFDRGDPLLYIESIPYWETRAYVPTVLRNYWVYEEQAGRAQSSSRTALVQGLWPRFPGLPGATAVRITPQNYASAAAPNASVK